MNRQAGKAVAEALGPSLWVLALTGEHDLVTADTLAAAFSRIEQSGTTVVLDLSEATFIDSTTLGAILNADRRGENLLLVAPNGGPARRLLDLVNVAAGRISVFETREEALGAVPEQDRPVAGESAGTGPS
jgi:anti-anti-sigma factor